MEQPGKNIEGYVTIDELVRLFTSGQPISMQDLETFEFPNSIYARQTMPKFKRSDSHRIFVNRSLRLDRIEFFGFDMDYTIACYNQEYEELCYNMIMNQLVNDMGYPEEIKLLEYDPTFPIRGLFIDSELGNILKVDAYGVINVCVHGKTVIPKEQVAKLYRSKRIVNKDIGRRFYLLNTLFSTPEACVFANLVEHFGKKDPQYECGKPVASAPISLRSTIDCEIPSTEPPTSDQSDNSQTGNHIELYYKNLWTDIHSVVDSLHMGDVCKSETLKDLSKYVTRSHHLSSLLHKLRSSDKKVFLLTNSPWAYTNKLMSYLLDGYNPDYKTWLDYWDIVIVAAEKPSFFGVGSTLREVDPITGKLSLGRIHGKFDKGKIYHGGNLETMESMAGISSGDTVLYVGDHIFSDVRVSKKRRGWRTMLIVPELEHELCVLAQKNTQRVFSRLYSLQLTKACIYRDFDSDSTEPPHVEHLQSAISATVQQKDSLYNKYFGSLFSTGLKPSFLSQQVLRYACIYAANFSHLLHYPIFYSFSSDSSLLPHENIFMHNNAEK